MIVSIIYILLLQDKKDWAVESNQAIVDLHLYQGNCPSVFYANPH